MALDFFAGCVGGCAGVLVGHPFDTIKVRLQTQDPARPRYAGTLHCLRTMVAEESVRGLYKGVTSPLAGVSLVNALVFGVYGNVQRQLDAASPGSSSSLACHALAGGAAGAVQSVACSPVELAKTRLQLQADGAAVQYKGPVDCLQQMFRTEGVRGVYRGFWPTLAREVPAFSVYFASYEWMTRGDAQVPTWRLLLAGGLAGTFSWVLTYPVDVVKSRVQADGLHGAPRYRGALHCLSASMAAEGPGFLFRGLSSTILRAFPTNAATFAVVAWTMRLLQDAEDVVQDAVQDVAMVPAAVLAECHHQHPALLDWIAPHYPLESCEL
ncbi:mitochondrial basic amino acids transporter [Frankliniella occidentalis]|uniref:Mitochondrial basic amino acids transporter n=1 Tax=Frankliniella occidentalis TaxID=133901 RepID=A0A9C6XSS9_FRAOC|nr:mitochondrial basic amino acids transporter [Frankliniella occidentalis]